MSRNPSEFIKSFINQKISTNEVERNFFKEQIVVLDNSKDDYLNAISKVDQNIFLQIENVNNKIMDVKNAYDSRINVGCRTDLFWRYTGVSTISGPTPGSVVTFENFVCVQSSPVGFGTTSIEYLTNSGIVQTSDNLLGLQEDNLYGVRIYDEPYSQDIVNSYVGSFIGTIGLGSTILTVMSPRLSDELSNQIQVGQIIIDNDSNIFSPGLANEIVGIATTMANLSVVGFETSTPVEVNQLILKYASINSASAPQPDNTYVSFTVLLDSDSVENYGLSFGSSPYDPQTIKMMTNSTIGSGVLIEFDNASGYPNVSQSWNKFLEGFEDPSVSKSKKITKPQVGQGKVYYRVGFNVKPQKNGVDAQIGDTGQNSDSIFYADEVTVVSTSACSSTINTTLSNAISTRDAAEANLASSNSDLNQKIKLSNMIRDDLNEINLRIWAYRTQMGESTENISTYNERLEELNTNAFRDIIDS